MARPCKTDGNREQTRASSAAKDIDDACRARVHDNYTVKEGALLKSLVANLRLSHEDREKAAAAGAEYVRRVRNETSSSKMEAVLAEALLWMPDAETIDDLIEDKVVPSNRGAHPGHCASDM